MTLLDSVLGTELTVPGKLLFSNFTNRGIDEYELGMASSGCYSEINRISYISGVYTQGIVEN